MSPDVLVVGGGFAGLSAASELVERGCSVLVLEAQDRVGGRTKPGTLAGLTIDLGGMWLGPTQRRLAGLASKFGVETYPNPLAGSGVVELGGKRVRSAGESVTEALDAHEMEDYLTVASAIETLWQDIDLDAPWGGREARALDGVTVGGWLRENAKTQTIRNLFRFTVCALFCAEPQEMSLLWMLTYLKAGGGLATVVSADEGGAQNLLFEGGVHQIARRLAADLGGRVRLNEPVTSLKTEGSDALVKTPAATHRGARTILAVPPALLERIDFDPPLPARYGALHSRMVMGSVIKCWIAYDGPFWRQSGLNGLILSGEAPFSPVFDVTPPTAEIGVLSGFFDGDGRHCMVSAHSGRAPPVRHRRRQPGSGRSRTFASGLRRERLDPGAVGAGLLRRLRAPRHPDPVRAVPEGAGGPTPLGQHRDGNGVDGLHRRRHSVGPARGPGGDGVTVKRNLASGPARILLLWGLGVEDDGRPSAKAGAPQGGGVVAPSPA